MNTVKDIASHYLTIATHESAYEALILYKQLVQPQIVRPDFLIIGAPKCGTSSLYDYLIQHPQVKRALRKEVRYFDSNFQRGARWYGAHFRPAEPSVLNGEATTTYIFTPTVPKRVREAVPDVRLIVLLRDPLNRAISHYHHNVTFGMREKLPLYEAFAQEAARIAEGREQITREYGCWHPALSPFAYVQRSLYADQLAMWYEVFPADQLLILKSEDFFTNPEPTYHAVCRFLGLPEHDLPSYAAQNVGAYKSIDPAFAEQQRNFFRPHNERLKALTGIDFGWDAP